MINSLVNGTKFRSLVDTGCQQSVVSAHALKSIGVRYVGCRLTVTMLDGNTTECLGEVDLDIKIRNKVEKVRCLVSTSLVCGCSVILGMDTIKRFGGLCISAEGVPSFGAECEPLVAAVSTHKQYSTLEVDDSDFVAQFDGDKWTVKWRWKDKEPVLQNQCGQYSISDVCKEGYDQEVEAWIQNGWLEEHSESAHGKVQGVIPLMAAFQPNKQRKVRPVMDYSRELNQYISSNPGADVAVCQEKLREWRQFGPNCCMLDLKKAYLQLHVDKELQKFQAVRYKDKLFVMTRMGFGLSVAPKIMTKILGKVLSMDSLVEAGTDHYIDDIIVNVDRVTVAYVKEHLARFGLVTKEPEHMDDARVLGLRVRKDASGELQWSRDNDTDEVAEIMTKRKLFSLCGKLVGHYPVGSWLRVACSYMKRRSNECDWEEPIPEAVVEMLRETMEKLNANDPVKGIWSVSSGGKGTVWCDASNLAIGVSIEIDGQQVEDGCWLRRDERNHINVAELDGVIRGISCGVKWKIKDMCVVTDSATVYGWVKSIISNSKRPKVCGLGEMLIRRRLGMIAELIELYELDVQLKLVKSEYNLADKLTRVPKRWLDGPHT